MVWEVWYHYSMSWHLHPFLSPFVGPYQPGVLTRICFSVMTGQNLTLNSKCTLSFFHEVFRVHIYTYGILCQKNLNLISNPTNKVEKLGLIWLGLIWFPTQQTKFKFVCSRYLVSKELDVVWYSTQHKSEIRRWRKEKHLLENHVFFFYLYFFVFQF